MDSDVENSKEQTNKGRWKLLAVLAVCAMPLVGSYITYYFIKPAGRTNFGDLIDPRSYPIPAMASTSLDGKPATLENFKGKWIMLKVGPSTCLQDCQDQLFAMRQLRTMQGKEMERIVDVWLVTDTEPLETTLMREFDGIRMLRASAEAVAKWLPVDAGDKADGHIYLIDPLGNLMMRYPLDAATPQNAKKVSQDLNKLLKASAIG